MLHFEEFKNSWRSSSVSFCFKVWEKAIRHFVIKGMHFKFTWTYYQLISLSRASLSSNDRRQCMRSYSSISIFLLILKILYFSPLSSASFLSLWWCWYKQKRNNLLRVNYIPPQCQISTNEIKYLINISCHSSITSITYKTVAYHDLIFLFKFAITVQFKELSGKLEWLVSLVVIEFHSHSDADRLV